MMLIEVGMLPDEALPLAAFKAHLRQGTGFSETDVQEPVLTGFLRAALAAVEARIGKALIARPFTWTTSRWRDAGREELPIAPVRAVTGVTVVDRWGAETALDVAGFGLEADSMRPRVAAHDGTLPAIPAGGKVVIGFDAGFADDWAGVPGDVAQAVFLLAAHYYEYRDETSLARGCMPFGVQSLLERYRPMRLFSGGGAA